MEDQKSCGETMKFLQQLLAKSCSHRFTWPRADVYGCHYQICLDCGAAYEYDWQVMRQTGRLKPLASVAADANAKTPGWSWR